MSKKPGLFIPAWLKQIVERNELFSDAGLHGLLDHHAVTEQLGVALSNGRIRPETVADLLAGRLVLCSDPTMMVVAPTADAPTKTVSTSRLVAALLCAGVHKFAQRPDSRRCGMDEREYGDLWPREVVYPSGYDTAYPHLLLVDQTLQLDKLKTCCADTDFFVDPTNCCVLHGVPEHLLGPDGKRLKRAVIFWGYGQNLDHEVKDCRLKVTATNIPMIYWHGLWIIIQHKDSILRSHAIDLGGSRCGVFGAPSVVRFGRVRPRFLVDHSDRWVSCYSLGFRGSELVPVP